MGDMETGRGSNNLITKTRKSMKKKRPKQANYWEIRVKYKKKRPKQSNY